MPISVGRVPVSLLSFNWKMLSIGKFPMLVEIDPLIWLVSRSRVTSFTALYKDSGKIPVNMLESMSSANKPLRSPMSFGMVPVRLKLLFKSISTKKGKKTISSGKVPTRLFLSAK